MTSCSSFNIARTLSRNLSRKTYQGKLVKKMLFYMFLQAIYIISVENLQSKNVSSKDQIKIVKKFKEGMKDRRWKKNRKSRIEISKYFLSHQPVSLNVSYTSNCILLLKISTLLFVYKYWFNKFILLKITTGGKKQKTICREKH